MGRKKGKFGKFKERNTQDYHDMMWKDGFFHPIMGCGFNYSLMTPEPELPKIPKDKKVLHNSIYRCDK